jgi:hypothetical protein
METQIKQLTEEQFDSMFTPQINHIERALADPDTDDEDICSFSGCLYETFGSEIEYVLEMAKLNRVVTIIEGEDTEPDEDNETHSTIFYASGFHLVNRMGFLVLDKPYTFDFEVAIED